MPVLKVQTNIQYEDKKTFMKEATALLSEMLNKPEKFIMIHFNSSEDMMFAGNTAGLVYAELKSIGLPRGKTHDFSARLSGFFSKKLSVPADRVYIEFFDAPRDMFGWNGGTFER